MGSHVFRENASRILQIVRKQYIKEHCGSLRYVSSVTDSEVPTENATDKDEGPDYFGLSDGPCSENEMPFKKLDSHLKMQLTASLQPPINPVLTKNYGNVRFDKPFKGGSVIKEKFLDGESRYTELPAKPQKKSRSRNQTPEYVVPTKQPISKTEHTEVTSDTFIDDQYFTYNSSDSLSTDSTEQDNLRQHKLQKLSYNINSDSKSGDGQTNKKTYQANFIDNQYFGNTVTNDTHATKPIGIDSIKSKEEVQSKTIENRDLNEVDKQYFIDYSNTRMIQPPQKENAVERKGINKHVVKASKMKSNEVEINVGKMSIEHNSKAIKVQPESAKENESRINSEGRKHQENVTEDNKPVTAFDEIMKIRQESVSRTSMHGQMNPKDRDSKGFKILKHQVPNFDKAPSVDVLKMLQGSILYNNNDIVAISKPYGLPSQDGPGCFHHVIKYLDDQLIPGTELFQIHRLDKETTGIMVFAKNMSVATDLRDRFRKREVEKRYLVLTKNRPELPTGEIDIPIAESDIEGHVKMVLRPYRSPEHSGIMKKRQAGRDAVTRYRTLDTGLDCALLECFPQTGKKHQIRVHLAFGLNCPILGDHKYSHFDKLAPMRLSTKMLERLEIQQSKVRHLAMHLHARSLMFPQFLNGRNLYLAAPLPPHFVQNMKVLQLKLPSHM